MKHENRTRFFDKLKRIAEPHEQVDAPNELVNAHSTLLDDTHKGTVNWRTNDDSPTGAQISYLNTLTASANEPMPDVRRITKGQMANEITRLRDRLGLAPTSHD